MKALNLVIVGTGMYVCGRGTNGYGTILPAVLKWKRARSMGDIYMVGVTPRGVKLAKNAARGLMREMGVDAEIKFLPEGNAKDEKAYLKALDGIRRPACAIVAVPDHLHSEIAGAMISAGLHTLVVKPLAPTTKEASRLIKLQKLNKVYCAVEFHKRLDAANLKLKDAIHDGAIGDPLYIMVEYSQRKSIPHKMFKKWVGHTNVFQYLGVHYVDIIYYITGASPVRAMALGQKNWLRSKGIDTYDSIQGMIEWRLPSGGRFVSCILTNWIDPENTSAMSDQKIKVIGTKGRIESDQKRRGIEIVTDDKGVEEPNPYFCCSYGMKGGRYYRGYGIDSIHQFLDDVSMIEDRKSNIAGLEGSRPTFNQSMTSTAVIEAINVSLQKNGKWVAIKCA